MNAESAPNILDNLVQEKTGKPLNRLQRVIIQGVLDGFTYKEIKHNYAIARNYEICYIARYVAYHLWKLLTEVLKDAGIIDPDEKVRNKNLWESAMRVAQQSVQSEPVQKSQPPVPPDPMLDKKLHSYTLHFPAINLALHTASSLRVERVNFSSGLVKI
jgi:serine/threonine-protein kinase